ncbi:MAG: hypothetical protein ACQGVK_17070 [Myxococcota bacterium]
MSASTAITAQQEVIGRINRYSTLRGAERALYPSVRLRKSREDTGRGAGLLVTLRKLLMDLRAAGRPTPDLGERLAEVDLHLATMAEGVRSALEDVSMAQLRATLPPLTREARGEAASLLDFCLEGDGVAQEHVPLAEYLVTLLSSSPERGAQIVRCDPTRVTAAVERVCALARVRTGNACERAARELGNAAFEVTGLNDLVPLVRRMRAIKSDLGPDLFAPEALRSAVSYNVAVANRIEVLMQLERLRDHQEQCILDGLRALDAPGPGSIAEDGRHRPCSVLGSPGFHSLCEAVRSQLEGVEPVAGPSAKIAARIDIGELHAEEVCAFTDSLDEGASPLLRAAVVMGGLLPVLPELRDALQALDIDPAILVSQWLPELDAAMAMASGQLAGCGRGSEAAVVELARRRFTTG